MSRSTVLDQEGRPSQLGRMTVKVDRKKAMFGATDSRAPVVTAENGVASCSVRPS